MRLKHFFLVVLTAAASATAVCVVGQEQPLPAVKPLDRAIVIPPAPVREEPTVFLPSEPITEYQAPTIEDAARHNDFVTFDALYTSAQKRGEDVARWKTLHDVWTFAVSDPLGGFYDTAMYERLKAEYPGFASYIDPFRIVDSNGRTFYPTSETRQFLFDRAMAAETPRVAAVDTHADDARPAVKPHAPSEAAVEKPAATVARAAQKSREQKTTEAIPAARAEAASAPATAPVTVAAPVVVSATPAESATQPAVPTPAPTVTAPPVRVSGPNHAGTPRSSVVDSDTTARGVLLLIIGFIAIGVLAVILKAPRAHDDGEPHGRRADVSPITRSTPEKTEHRATGSHG